MHLCTMLRHSAFLLIRSIPAEADVFSAASLAAAVITATATATFSGHGYSFLFAVWPLCVGSGVWRLLLCTCNLWVTVLFTLPYGVILLPLPDYHYSGIVIFFSFFLISIPIVWTSFRHSKWQMLFVPCIYSFV